MKKSELKSIIITKTAVLALSAVLLAVMTFAWFLYADTVDRTQTLYIGKIDIDVIDGEQLAPAGNMIDVEAAYPMTRAQAIAAYGRGELKSYVFAVANIGDLSAQYRLSVQIVSDSNYGSQAGGVLPLAEQIAVVAREYVLDGQQAEFGEECLLFAEATPPENPRKSVKQFFNELLLESADGGLIAKSDRILAPQAEKYFELLVWLKHDATLESTGAPTQTDGQGNTVYPSVTFAVRAHALQYGGGAVFDADECGAVDAERVPSGTAA